MTERERARLERANEQAAIGERIVAYRESGMTWRAAAAVEGVNRDEARVCAGTYRSVAVSPWPRRR